jgi:hypothetical protein
MFDPQAAVATVREGALPHGWSVFPRRAAPVAGRIALGLLIFIVLGALAGWFITNRRAYLPSFISDQALTETTVNAFFYGESAVLAALALLGLITVARAVAVAVRLRDHFLLLTPEGIALSTGARVKGMAFASMSDMREAGGALVISGPQRASLTLRGSGYGDPEEIYSLVLAGARAQRSPT